MGEHQNEPRRKNVSRMQVFMSLTVLFAALFVILVGKYDSDTQKWAYGVVGLLIGFWFRRA